jgi:hypothetical protein
MYCVAQVDGSAIREVKDNRSRRRCQVVDRQVSAISNDAGIAGMYPKVADIDPP